MRLRPAYVAVVGAVALFVAAAGVAAAGDDAPLTIGNKNYGNTTTTL
jgi:hypothetical protein